MTDFSKVLIHASSVGKLLKQPKTKEAKLAGELSETAKTHLIEIYTEQKYGRKKELDNKYIRKGNAAEPSSLLLLSEHIGQFLDKNEQQLSNEWICGTPDTFKGESIENAEAVYDTKSSYDIFTFLSNLGDDLDDTYYNQIQSYLWLCNAPVGYIAYCLVDLPETQLESEKSYVLRKTNAISEESQEFKDAWAKKEPLFIYSDIPESERILLFKVEKDPCFPEMIKDKVAKARLFLADFEKTHLLFNK